MASRPALELVHHFRLLTAVSCQEKQGQRGGVGSEDINGVTQTNVGSICSYDKASKPQAR